MYDTHGKREEKDPSIYFRELTVPSKILFI
jgi:hypothetical protein